MKEEKCFGIIPVKKFNNKWKIFLVLHDKGKYYGFPKGHANEKETGLAAAKRELKEETSLEVVKLLAEQVFFEEYIFARDGEKIHKEVIYYLAEVNGNEEIASSEIIEGNWYTLAEGKKKLTYRGLKDILDEAVKILKLK